MEIQGRVTDALPNLTYKVATDEVVGVKSREIICYVSGKMKLNKIYVSVGDRVLIKLDPYGGKATNRITRRL